LEKYKDLGTEQKSKEAFDQDAMAYASITIASDPTLDLNAEWRKRLQEAFGERLTREVSMI
jgi:hypothetical protein